MKTFASVCCFTLGKTVCSAVGKINEFERSLFLFFETTANRDVSGRLKSSCTYEGYIVVLTCANKHVF